MTPDELLAVLVDGVLDARREVDAVLQLSLNRDQGTKETLESLGDLS